MLQPADLVGRKMVDAAGRTLIVTGPASWSPTYTELETEDGTFRTVRNTAQLIAYFAATRA